MGVQQQNRNPKILNPAIATSEGRKATVAVMTNDKCSLLNATAGLLSNFAIAAELDLVPTSFEVQGL
jgi:hypothetical protein